MFFLLFFRRYNPSQSQENHRNAFELQNLSDCGLNKNILDAFCRADNIDTINSKLECKNGQFRWI
jgi:hypothetical protein